jgi:adenylate cyclase class IV
LKEDYTVSRVECRKLAHELQEALLQVTTLKKLGEFIQIEKTSVIRECNMFKSKTEQLDRDCQNTAEINLKLRNQTTQHKRDLARLANEI